MTEENKPNTEGFIGYGTTSPKAKYTVQVNSLLQLWRAVVDITWYKFKQLF